MKSVKEMAELIYDKLADNDEYEQFDHEHTDDMCLVAADGIIAIVMDGVEYVLRLERNELGNYKVFENTEWLK